MTLIDYRSITAQAAWRVSGLCRLNFACKIENVHYMIGHTKGGNPGICTPLKAFQFNLVLFVKIVLFLALLL